MGTRGKIVETITPRYHSSSVSHTVHYDVNYEKIEKQGKNIKLSEKQIKDSEKERNNFVDLMADKVLNKRMRTEKRKTDIHDYRATKTISKKYKPLVIGN